MEKMITMGDDDKIDAEFEMSSGEIIATARFLGKVTFGELDSPSQATGLRKLYRLLEAAREAG